MAEKITVPTLGESVTEATVSKWLKSQGEEVTVDEPLVELETDKVNVEVPSPTSGVLGTIAVNEGETVNVGSLLGTINGSATTDNNIKEVNNYTPPEKENTIEEIKIFEEEKILKPKKQKKITTLLNILILHM
jgi:2-oxoglutarate dehydrogenase E2 component (dihydrolipoamide succinyltransferase)